MSEYNWQQPDWTVFRYELSGLEGDLSRYVERTGRLDGLTTATRDMSHLLELGVFERLGDAGGRSTAYGLRLD